MRSLENATDFSDRILQALTKYEGTSFRQNLDDFNNAMEESMHAVSISILPKLRTTPKKPWTSADSLALVEQRSLARGRGDYEEEKRLQKALKKNVQAGQTIWLTQLAGDGSWRSVKALRKPPKPQQGRLRNLAGE